MLRRTTAGLLIAASLYLAACSGGASTPRVPSKGPELVASAKTAGHLAPLASSEPGQKNPVLEMAPTAAPDGPAGQPGQIHGGAALKIGYRVVGDKQTYWYTDDAQLSKTATSLVVRDYGALFMFRNANVALFHNSDNLRIAPGDLALENSATLIKLLDSTPDARSKSENCPDCAFAPILGRQPTSDESQDNLPAVTRSANSSSKRIPALVVGNPYCNPSIQDCTDCSFFGLCSISVNGDGFPHFQGGGSSDVCLPGFVDMSGFGFCILGLHYPGGIFSQAIIDFFESVLLVKDRNVDYYRFFLRASTAELKSKSLKKIYDTYALAPHELYLVKSYFISDEGETAMSERFTENDSLDSSLYVDTFNLTIKQGILSKSTFYLYRSYGGTFGSISQRPANPSLGLPYPQSTPSVGGPSICNTIRCVRPITTNN